MGRKIRETSDLDLEDLCASFTTFTKFSYLTVLRSCF